MESIASVYFDVDGQKAYVNYKFIFVRRYQQKLCFQSTKICHRKQVIQCAFRLMANTLTAELRAQSDPIPRLLTFRGSYRFH